MVLFPNAKINLGLRITGKRSDGYHLLETLFYPIPLSDVLEIGWSKGKTDTLHTYGSQDLPATDDNLVMRATALLRKHYDFPALDLHLYKAIPSGAGMGGGSSDASFTLRGINQLAELGITDKELETLTLELGADCPFFIQNQACWAQGIGEQLSPCTSVDLSGYHILVLKPELHISTAEAFAGLGAITPLQEHLTEALSRPIETWQGSVINDFEQSLFPKHPVLARLKQYLIDKGALYASMTGSGSALYGLFDTPVEIDHQDLDNCFIWQSKL